jgi:hypothetical protein
MTTQHLEVRHKYCLTADGSLGVRIKLAVDTVDLAAEIGSTTPIQLSHPCISATNAYMVPVSLLLHEPGQDHGTRHNSQTLHSSLDDLATAYQDALVAHYVAAGANPDTAIGPASQEASRIHDIILSDEHHIAVSTRV